MNNIKNIFFNKSIGPGVELLETPKIKYDNSPNYFIHNYLPKNYSLFAENIHNLFIEEKKHYNSVINIISILECKERRDLISNILDNTDWVDNNKYKFNIFEKTNKGLGWVGCAINHLKIIREAYNKKLDYVIIAEDDFIPVCNKITNSIYKAINILNENENLDLYNSFTQGNLNNTVKKRLRDNAYEVAGGILNHFIIIHKRAFKKFINYEKYYYNQTSSENKQFLAFDELVNKHFNQFTLHPFLFYQYSQDSYIEEIKHNDYNINSLLKYNLDFDITNVEKFNFNTESDTTVVMISCGRFQEALNTIKTFYKYNTYDINNFIIIDDSHNKKMFELNDYYKEINLIQISENGHNKNLDLAFELSKKLNSKYVFLIEDDWEFVNSYFIELSKKIIENNDNVINVWLRDLNDTNNHPLKMYKKLSNIHTYILENNYEWHGFTFNPSLKRIDNFDDNFFSDVYNTIEDKKTHYLLEKKVDNYYHSLDFISVILPYASVFHTGYIKSIPRWLK